MRTWIFWELPLAWHSQKSSFYSIHIYHLLICSTLCILNMSIVFLSVFPDWLPALWTSGSHSSFIFNFWTTLALFPIVTVLLYISINCIQELLFLHVFLELVILVTVIVTGMMWQFTETLACNFLMIIDLWAIFVGLPFRNIYLDLASIFDPITLYHILLLVKDCVISEFLMYYIWL